MLCCRAVTHRICSVLLFFPHIDGLVFLVLLGKLLSCRWNVCINAAWRLEVVILRYVLAPVFSPSSLEAHMHCCSIFSIHGTWNQGESLLSICSVKQPSAWVLNTNWHSLGWAREHWVFFLFLVGFSKFFVLTASCLLNPFICLSHYKWKCCCIIWGFLVIRQQQYWLLYMVFHFIKQPERCCVQLELAL